MITISQFTKKRLNDYRHFFFIMDGDKSYYRITDSQIMQTEADVLSSYIGTFKLHLIK